MLINLRILRCLTADPGNKWGMVYHQIKPYDMKLFKSKRHWLVTLCLLISSLVSAQTQPNSQGNPLEAFTYDLGSESFLTIRAQGMAFYQNKIQQFGINQVETEGSPYTNFIRFIDEWEAKLAPYNYSLQAYMSASGSSGSHMLASPYSWCNWKELGPVVSTQGPTDYGNDAYIHGIGHTEFVRIAKHDPQRMLGGSIYGGLFYSSDAGQTWKCVSDKWAVPGCSWAAFSDADPGVIVAAQTKSQDDVTGKASFTEKGGGIMISEDYGATWSKLMDTETSPMLNRYSKINKVVFDPNNPDAIYIGMTGGLFRYSNINDHNSAAQLNLIADFKTVGSFENTNCMDIEVIRHPDLFPLGSFIAVTVNGNIPGTPNSQHSRAFVSNNGGTSFAEVFTSIGVQKQSTFEYSPVTASDPFTLDEAVIHYCTYITTGSPVISVWTLNLTDYSETMLFSKPENYNYGSCFSFGVSPLDENKIVTTDELYLYGTLDNYSTASNMMSTSSIHGDLEHVVWHPTNPNEVWLCTHGGIERSTDNGATWESMSVGLGVANVMTFDDVSADPNKMLVSLFHGGTARFNSHYLEPQEDHDWQYFAGGDGFGAAIIEEDDINFYFASSQSSSGSTYATAYGPLSSNLSHANGRGFNAWFEPSMDNTSVYTPGQVGSNSDVFQANLVPGTLPSFFAVSDFNSVPGYTKDYRVRKIKSSETDEKMLFALGWEEATGADGRDRFLLYNTKANSNSPTVIKNDWKEIIMPYDDGVSINPYYFFDVAGSHYIDGRYYIVTSKGVYQLDFDDSGDYEIKDITGNLPDCNFQGFNDDAILVEKGTNEGLYVIMKCGVFYTHASRVIAGNQHWVRSGTGIPATSKNGIRANYSINKIRVGTDGRGLWEGCFMCPDGWGIMKSGFHGPGYEFIEAEAYILSTAKVIHNRHVKYRAGHFIELNPGFSVYSGGLFETIMHPCAPDRDNGFKSLSVDPWSYVPKAEPEKVEQVSPLELMPNPTSGNLRVSMLDFDTEKQHQLEIRDVTGKLLIKQRMDANVIDLDVSQLPSGMYLVIVTSNNEIINQSKLIKTD